MRICFFNRSYWPDQAATGQLLTELAQDLATGYGCTVSVVAGRALHRSEGDHSMSDERPRVDWTEANQRYLMAAVGVGVAYGIGRLLHVAGVG